MSASSSSNFRVAPQPIIDIGQLATEARGDQTCTPVHTEQRPSRADGLRASPERASKLAGMRVRDVPDPSAHRMRLPGGALPYSQRPEPPANRDSTRVLVRPSGKAVVVFARDASGVCRQKFVSSVAEATEVVVEYRLAQIVTPLLAWLASFLPPKSSRPLAKTEVGRSGVRSKAESEALKRGAR